MARSIFSSEKWQCEANERLQFLKNLTFENLGAGFYSFNFNEKYNFYSQARANVGAMLALLLESPSSQEAWKLEIENLELKLIPALSALIKKMEKKLK